MNDVSNKEKCGCFCHCMKGVFIALIGVDLLLGALNVLSPQVVAIIWPSLLILIGLQKTGLCKCCEKTESKDGKSCC